MSTTLELIRGYMNNQSVTLNDNDQVRMEETGQTFGAILTGAEMVKEHLRTLTLDAGNEWHGVDEAELYSEPQTLRDGLVYLGENTNGDEVWYQGY